jgi:hypothetical protein
MSIDGYAEQINDRIHYMKLRRRGLDPQAIAQETIQEKQKIVIKKTMEFAGILLEGQKEVETTLADLSEQVEVIDPTRAARPQVENLKLMVDELKERENGLIGALAKSQGDLQAQEKAKAELQLYLQKLSEALKNSSSHPECEQLALFFGQNICVSMSGMTETRKSEKGV